MRPNKKRADPLSDCDFTISWTKCSPDDNSIPKNHMYFDSHVINLMHLKTNVEFQIKRINSLPQMHK